MRGSPSTTRASRSWAGRRSSTRRAPAPGAHRRLRAGPGPGPGARRAAGGGPGRGAGRTLGPRAAPGPAHHWSCLVARLSRPRDALVYRIHVELENGARETAHAGLPRGRPDRRILKRWSSLRTGRAAIGLGHSQYSGNVTLDTTWTAHAKGYELRDWTRGQAPATSCSTSQPGHRRRRGAPTAPTTDTWGDGQNYTGGDHHLGQRRDRGGGRGLRPPGHLGLLHAGLRPRTASTAGAPRSPCGVHYDTDFDNAFWADACFCVTIGDGRCSSPSPPWTSSATSCPTGSAPATANLDYYGESGGPERGQFGHPRAPWSSSTPGAARGAAIGDWAATGPSARTWTTADHPGPLRCSTSPARTATAPTPGAPTSRTWTCTSARAP